MSKSYREVSIKRPCRAWILAQESSPFSGVRSVQEQPFENQKSPTFPNSLSAATSRKENGIGKSERMWPKVVPILRILVQDGLGE